VVIKGLRLLNAMRIRLPYYVSLSISFCFFLSACTTLTPRFKGPIFLIESIPKEHCTEELWKFGIYRKLANGDREYLPFCDVLVEQYVVSHYRDVELVEEASE